MKRHNSLWRKVLGWNVGDRCIAHLPSTSIRLKGVIQELGVVWFFRGKEVSAAIVTVWGRRYTLCPYTEIVPLRNLEEYHE